jgi:hypothetical protein
VSTWVADRTVNTAHIALQALHALGLADPKLCMPSKDQAQFVRALAPYLKVLGCMRSTCFVVTMPTSGLNMRSQLKGALLLNLFAGI